MTDPYWIIQDSQQEWPVTSLGKHMWFWIIVINILFGIILARWHQRLMIWLHNNQLDKWRSLGRDDVTGKMWLLSTRLPLWSWSSIIWFVLGKYKLVNDTGFIERANRFRFWLVLWLLEFVIKCVVGVLIAH